MTHQYSDIIDILIRLFIAALILRIGVRRRWAIYLPADDDITPQNCLPFCGFCFCRYTKHNTGVLLALNVICWKILLAIGMSQMVVLSQFKLKFEKVEIRPQAYEWIIATSAGFPFNVSCDNPTRRFWARSGLAFMNKVHSGSRGYLWVGLPPRVKMLSEALRKATTTM